MERFPFDVVAFDLDGTLADTAPDLAAALNYALCELGFAPVPVEDLRHMVGHGARAMLKTGLAANGVDAPELVDRGFPFFLEYYAANVASGTRAYDGLETALDELNLAGVKLAICTNKLEGLSRQLISALGWDGRFAALVGSDTLPVCKPDPAPLALAIEQSGGGRAAFVGDSITDTNTAKALGIPCVAVTFGFSDRPVDQLGATALIDHYDELIPTLRRIGE